MLPPQYRLMTHNCTTWAFNVINNNTNVNGRPQAVPIDTVLARGNGLTPNRTGLQIRQMQQIPNGGIRLFPPGN